MASHQFGFLELLVSSVFISMFTIDGVNCVLTIRPGPSVVNATVGSNVTLAVKIFGALDPMVTWKMGSLPVVIWTLASGVAPAVSDSNRDVLKIQADGSLLFQNVSLAYSNTYTLDVVKVGMDTVSTQFSLSVFDYIRNVSVAVQTADAIEGAENLTLQYSSVPGEPSQWWWYFNGVLIRNSSHYTVAQKSLVIYQPNRTDAGRYTLLLANPFSAVTTHRNITVLYGPDEPVLGLSPSQAFFVSGDSLSLSCQAEGVPLPLASWLFRGQTIGSQGGRLNLTGVQTSQGGMYTCELFNEHTGVRRRKNLTVNVYERPAGSPLCSVYASNGNADLQFNCRWPGGTPEALLSFPSLNTTSGAGDFSLTRPASQDLNGKTVLCRVNHPLLQTQCNVTPSGPADILPMITTVDQGGQIVVNIQCHSQAMPKALVTWFQGSEILANGTNYQINDDATQLSVHNFNHSTAHLFTYTCNCSNPLGSTAKETQLLGPTISYSRLFPSGDGTAVTITWEVPPTSVITGFDIQMSGPDLLAKSARLGQKATDHFRTIQQKPGTFRSTNISTLDPKSTYQFRVIPFAGKIQGNPSGVQRLGPGLSQPQIIGLAAGIPCGVLLLLLLIGLICLCICCSRKKSKANRYPVARVVEKVVSTQLNIHPPSSLLTGGLKTQPGYDQNMAPEERSVPLPRFVSPPHVRTATIV